MSEKSKTRGHSRAASDEQIAGLLASGVLPVFTRDADGDVVLVAVFVPPAGSATAVSDAPVDLELPQVPGLMLQVDESLFDEVRGVRARIRSSPWDLLASRDVGPPFPLRIPTLSGPRPLLTRALTEGFQRAQELHPDTSAGHEFWSGWLASVDPDSEGRWTETAASPRQKLDEIRNQLVHDLTPPLAEIDPVPHAVVEQARLLAGLKTQLLSSGAFTKEALADGWDVSPAAAAKRVERYRARNQLFTVSHNGETLVPAFVLDDHMQLRPELEAPIRALTAVGEDGFALWSWLVTPSGWLDGAVPAEVAASDPERVATAAERRASNAA